MNFMPRDAAPARRAAARRAPWSEQAATPAWCLDPWATRNNNSSRFGRYALVRFTAEGEVVGANLRTFLLERSRVTSTSKVMRTRLFAPAHLPNGVQRTFRTGSVGC